MSPSAMPPETGKVKLTLNKAHSKPPTVAGAKRPQTALFEDEPDERAADHAPTYSDGRHRAIKISTFNEAPTPKSIRDAPQEFGEPERIIAPIPNRDWREIRERKRRRKEESDPSEEPAERSEQEGQPHANGDQIESNARDTSQPATSEIESLQAIEEAAFRADYEAAPRNATLAEYAATPIEGFGAALLRGYMRPGQTLEDLSESRAVKKAGAKPGEKDKAPERRRDLLGLGAKPMDLGPGLEDKKKGARRAVNEMREYNPAMMVKKENVTKADDGSRDHSNHRGHNGDWKEPRYPERDSRRESEKGSHRRIRDRSHDRRDPDGGRHRYHRNRSCDRRERGHHRRDRSNDRRDPRRDRNHR